MEVEGFMPGIRLGAKARRVNVGASSGQHYAVDRIQQGPDIGDIGGSGKHQRQRARDFGHRAKVSLSDQLCRKSIFDAIGASDHTDHRPPHRLLSNLPPQIWPIMPASPHRINISRPGAWLHCYFRVKTCFGSIASPRCKPAAWSAFPAGSSGRFHHGNLASIPRVTGWPNGPAFFVSAL